MPVDRGDAMGCLELILGFPVSRVCGFKVVKRTFRRLHHLYASLQPKVWGVLSFCLVGCMFFGTTGRDGGFVFVSFFFVGGLAGGDGILVGL